MQNDGGWHLLLVLPDTVVEAAVMEELTVAVTAAAALAVVDKLEVDVVDTTVSDEAKDTPDPDFKLVVVVVPEAAVEATGLLLSTLAPRFKCGLSLPGGVTV